VHTRVNAGSVHTRANATQVILNETKRHTDCSSDDTNHRVGNVYDCWPSAVRACRHASWDSAYACLFGRWLHTQTSVGSIGRNRDARAVAHWTYRALPSHWRVVSLGNFSSSFAGCVDYADFGPVGP
jgi:hypothetical protein